MEDFEKAYFREIDDRREYLLKWFGEKCEDYCETCILCQHWKLQEEWEALHGIEQNFLQSRYRILIDVNDRNGNPIHVGDTLRFDEKEWGGFCEFQISIRKGEIQGCGTPEDWSNWCYIVKRGDNETT